MAKPNLIKIIDNKADKDYVFSSVETVIKSYDIIANVYTKGEIDSFLNLKSNIDHEHNHIYITTEKALELLLEKAEKIHYHDDLYATKEELRNAVIYDLGGILTENEINGVEFIRRGGTYEEHKNFIGAEKEITIDTTNWTIKVHDGITPGGRDSYDKTIVSNVEPDNQRDGGVWIDTQ